MQNQSAVERQLAKLRDENNVLKEGKENVENELILLKNKVNFFSKFMHLNIRIMESTISLF